MRVALYVRVSTERQQLAQTIEQQVTRLRDYLATQPDWVVQEEHIFRDDGYSGAKLDRPGLDALRTAAAQAASDRLLICTPDRLARNYVHQMVVLEALERRGVRVFRRCGGSPRCEAESARSRGGLSRPAGDRGGSCCGCAADASSSALTRSGETPASPRMRAMAPRGSCSAASSRCPLVSSVPASRASLDAFSISRLAWEVWAGSSPPPRGRPRRPPASRRDRTWARSRPSRRSTGSALPPGRRIASRMCSAPMDSWPSRRASSRAPASACSALGPSVRGLTRGVESWLRAAWLLR